MDNNDASTGMPQDLIAESPEAKEFVRRTIAGVDALKLFPDEQFASVIGNVLSGTGLDGQGESAQFADLEALVQAVQSGEFWLRREHDPLIHPIGRVVAAKVFYDPKLNMHFVVGVVGFYDTSKLPTFVSKGIDVSTPTVGDREIPENTGIPCAQVEFNPHEISPAVIAEMLNTAPKCVNRSVVEQSRKGLIGLAILQISTSIYLLSKTPFGGKYQERLGEKAADASAEFLKWIADSVVSKVRRVTGRDTRVVMSFEYKGCVVEFVLKGTEGPAAIAEAMAAMEGAADQSLRLVEVLESTLPRRLTYGYDVASKKWFPLHASTRNEGIITDQPYLVALDNLKGGFSVGGRRLPVSTGREKGEP